MKLHRYLVVRQAPAWLMMHRIREGFDRGDGMVFPARWRWTRDSSAARANTCTSQNERGCRGEERLARLPKLESRIVIFIALWRSLYQQRTERRRRSLSSVTRCPARPCTRTRQKPTRDCLAGIIRSTTRLANTFAAMLTPTALSASGPCSSAASTEPSTM